MHLPVLTIIISWLELYTPMRQKCFSETYGYKEYFKVNFKIYKKLVNGNFKTGHSVFVMVKLLQSAVLYCWQVFCCCIMRTFQK